MYQENFILIIILLQLCCIFWKSLFFLHRFQCTNLKDNNWNFYILASLCHRLTFISFLYNCAIFSWYCSLSSLKGFHIAKHVIKFCHTSFFSYPSLDVSNNKTFSSPSRLIACKLVYFYTSTFNIVSHLRVCSEILHIMDNHNFIVNKWRYMYISSIYLR